jgi:hypothetical protein
MWLFLVLLSRSAVGMEPPIGWTAMGTDRAQVAPGDPGRGELWELTVPGGTGRTEEITGVLSGRGYQLRVTGQDPDGSVLLAGGGLVGKARPSAEAGSCTWHVVLASDDAARYLDVGALLALISAPPPATLGGQGRVEVVEGGNDGSAWSPFGAAQDNTLSSTPWSTDSAWPLDGHFFGLWTGRMTVRDQRVQVRLRLEASGMATLEWPEGNGEHVTQGVWGVKDQIFKISGYSGENVESRYTLKESVLTLRLGEQTVDFHSTK